MNRVTAVADEKGLGYLSAAKSLVSSGEATAEAAASVVRFPEGYSKKIPFEQLQNQAIGPFAKGATRAADTIHIVRAGGANIIQQPQGYISNIPEYTNSANVAPDAREILDFN